MWMGKIEGINSKEKGSVASTRSIPHRPGAGRNKKGISAGAGESMSGTANGAT